MVTYLHLYDLFTPFELTYLMHHCIICSHKKCKYWHQKCYYNNFMVVFMFMFIKLIVKVLNKCK